MDAEAVIQELRTMQGFGLISDTHCMRCERLLERYPHLTLLGDAERVAEIVVEEA